MRQNGSAQNGQTFQIEHLTENGTADLARATADLAIACLTAPGIWADDAFMIHLHGDLGAGKTTFARSVLKACGVTGRIKSPSFSVLESYQAHGRYLHHLDFYRQADPAAWQAGGLREIMASSGIVLVEWPEHAQGLPAAAIELWLSWAIEGQADGPRRAVIRLAPELIQHMMQSDNQPLHAARARWQKTMNDLSAQDISTSHATDHVAHTPHG